MECWPHGGAIYFLKSALFKTFLLYTLHLGPAWMGQTLPASHEALHFLQGDHCPWLWELFEIRITWVLRIHLQILDDVVSWVSADLEKKWLAWGIMLNWCSPSFILRTAAWVQEHFSLLCFNLNSSLFKVLQMSPSPPPPHWSLPGYSYPQLRAFSRVLWASPWRG